MKRLSKQTFTWLLSLMLFVTMSTGITFAAEPSEDVNTPDTPEIVSQESGPTIEENAESEENEAIADENAEELGEDQLGAENLDGQFELVLADGQSVTITFEQIMAAGAETVTADAPWKYNGTAEAYGTFYSFKKILETAGINYSDAHGLKVVATDGFTSGYTTAEIDNLYIYDMSQVTKNGKIAGAAGTLAFAVKDTEGTTAGNRWANNIATVSITNDHVWFVKGGKCRHYCSICGAYQDLQSIISEEDQGGTGNVALSLDLVYPNDVELSFDADDTVTIDFGGKNITVGDGTGKINVKSGNVILKNGTVNAVLSAAEGATIKAESGTYNYELPEANLVDGKVPVYTDGAYKVKTVSAYESQSLANMLQRQIGALSNTINQLTATISLHDITVKATATQTAYNAVKVRWEANQDVDGFKVQKKVNNEWTDVKVTGNVLEEAAEPGIANDYRVAAQVKYDTTDGTKLQVGKYVSASVTTKPAGAVISKVTTKSKKLTAKWSAVGGADSYDVWIGTNSAVTKGLVKYNNVKALSKKSKALKKNKVYYVKVRAHVKNSAGTVVYGAWSKAKKIKCK